MDTYLMCFMFKEEISHTVVLLNHHRMTALKLEYETKHQPTHIYGLDMMKDKKNDRNGQYCFFYFSFYSI